MNTTAGRTTQAAQAIPREILDAWVSSFKSLDWTFEQMEGLTTNWMKQTKAMRQDGQKVLEALAEQAKSNGDFAGFMDQGLKGVPGWDVPTLVDLRRQIDDLSARVDVLSNR
ncbi:MAG TPA: hypothetical protein DD435_11770 [Cyanobacteria bacterium UBA8530]|nr:hypothetical protein [Cyanobacteria bacterium UBA8530]